MNKKKLAILAFGGTNWIGGIYYTKNIAYQLFLNDELRKKIDIYLFTYSDLINEFNGLQSSIRIIAMKRYSNPLLFKIALLFSLFKMRIKVVFPAQNFIPQCLFKKIYWIPDFQHNRLPSFFNKEEISARDSLFNKIYKSKQPLILSSNDAKNDFETFYGKNKRNVYVMPFISFLPSDLINKNESYEKEVLNRFGLNDLRFVCVANQFWAHKNHIVVFDAIKRLFAEHPTLNIVFVFTGKVKDGRDKSYTDYINKIINLDYIKKHCVFTDFVKRSEQVVLLKRSLFIIQPSLFEGWGTVVEDAKTLGKVVLLSDIPVHHEQMDKNCILFNPHNPIELANLIFEESLKQHLPSFEDNVLKTEKKGEYYSQVFANVLKDYKII